MSGAAARAPAGAGAEHRHACPLCGNRFGEEEARCGGCPLNRGCGTLCCPRCGYEFVEHSATLSALSKAAGGVRRWIGALRRGRG